MSNRIQYPVTPSFSVEEAAAKLTNKDYQTLPIAREFVRVAPYNPQYAFTHQQGLAMFKGKLYVTFSRGYAHEDFPGQEMVVVSSENFYDWSEPKVIGPCHQGTYDKTTIITGNLYSRGDRLIAYFAEHDWCKAKFTENGFSHDQPTAGTQSWLWMTYTEDGETWSDPVPSPGNAHESPRQTLTGEWLASWGDGVLFSDAETPDGGDWVWNCLSEEQRQFGYAQGAKMLGECSWYQLDDGVINMLIRNDMMLDGKQIFNAMLSQSYDGGRTWTNPYRAENFRIDWQMVNTGRLPDGRFYFVSTTALNRQYGRYPLILLVSDNGYTFTRGYTLRDELHDLQQEGWSKGGEYGYPEVLIYGDYMYIVCSRLKEVVELTRVKLSDIQ